MKQVCKGIEDCDTSMFEMVNENYRPIEYKPVKKTAKKKKPKRPDFEYRLIDYAITSVMSAVVFILFMCAVAWCWQ